MASVRSALFLLGALSVAAAGCARGPVGEYEADAAQVSAPPDASDDGTDSAMVSTPDAARERPDAARGPGDAALPPGNGRTDSGLPTPQDAGTPSSGDADTGVDAGSVGDAAPEPEPVDAGNSEPVDSGPPPAPDTGPPAPRCVPGTYIGVFEGEISALLGLVRIDISGTITLHLALTGTGDRLEIMNGTLDGSDQDANAITAGISGSLNCATREFENGRISNGTYTRVDPIFGGPPTTVGFTGTATAMYFEDPPSAQGRWEVVNETGLRGGSGTWTARLQN